MCTAISVNKNVFLFGRTLDWFSSFSEKIIITPRNYVFSFLECGDMSKHYAIIGMGIERGGYPLYFDAFNEKGLCVAGLNFPDNCMYYDSVPNLQNIASFEFIPWVLGQCKSVLEAVELIKKTNITTTAFNNELPPTPLHWILSDKDKSVTVECLKDEMKIYDNEIGVLCNNPPFSYHTENIKRYMSLSVDEPENKFSNYLTLTPNSFGFGAIGLPGDFSSSSRFVRVAFIKENADFTVNPITQFFKILSNVSVTKGIVKNNGQNEYTVYTSCCDVQNGIYYYKTYDGDLIKSVSFENIDLDGTKIKSFEIYN